MSETVYQLAENEMDALAEGQRLLEEALDGYYGATEIVVEFRYPEKRVRVVLANDPEGGGFQGIRYEVGY